VGGPASVLSSTGLTSRGAERGADPLGVWEGYVWRQAVAAARAGMQDEARHASASSQAFLIELSNRRQRCLGTRSLTARAPVLPPPLHGRRCVCFCTTERSPSSSRSPPPLPPPPSGSCAPAPRRAEQIVKRHVAAGRRGCFARCAERGSGGCCRYRGADGAGAAGFGPNAWSGRREPQVVCLFCSHPATAAFLSLLTGVHRLAGTVQLALAAAAAMLAQRDVLAPA